MGLLLEPFVYILHVLLSVYFYIIVIEVILHWLIQFGIVNLDNGFMQRLTRVLESLTRPVYAKVRAYVPPFSGIDFSPFILLLALTFLQRLLWRISQLLAG